MDYKEIIDKLVRELSFRVGVPNIHDKEHQSIMSEILSEWGEYDIKETIFEFLNEDDKIDDETPVDYRDKNGNKQQTTYKNDMSSDKESPQYKALKLKKDGGKKDDSVSKSSVDATLSGLILSLVRKVKNEKIG